VYLGILLSLQFCVWRGDFLSRELRPKLDKQYPHFLRHSYFSVGFGFAKDTYRHTAPRMVLFTEADAVLTRSGTEGAQLLSVKLSTSLPSSAHWQFWRSELIFLHSLHLHATRGTFKAQSCCWVLRNASLCSFPPGWLDHSPAPGQLQRTRFCQLY